MKKTLTTLGMGACVLLAFNSCQSTDGDGYRGYEEATPMSEFVNDMTVADGEIPPWLLEDSGENQVDAGATTHSHIPLPTPGEPAYESGSRVSAGQQQPGMAANSDVTIERYEDDIIIAPLDASAPSKVIAPADAVANTIIKPDAPATAPVTPSETASHGALKKDLASNQKTSGKKKPRKPAKRVTEPTLVSYKVKPGDNLSEIARRSNTTVAAIRKASGITGDTIYAGTTIKVPFTPNSYKMAQAQKQTRSGSYTVKRGDTLGRIASRNGITVKELMEANGLRGKKAATIVPGQKLTIPGKGGSTSSTRGNSKATTGKAYTVKRGDSLGKIAKANGVTVQQLMEANGLSAKEARTIRPGQKLTIPGKTDKTRNAKSGRKRSRQSRRR